MGNIIYVELKALTIDSDSTQDIWSLMAPAGNKLRLLGWELRSSAIAAAVLDLNLHFISAVGTIGAAATEVHGDNGNDATINGSVRTEDGSGGGAPGTPSGALMAYQWEQLGPVGHIFTPQMAPVIDISTGIALTLNTAATPTLSGFICWEDI